MSEKMHQRSYISIVIVMNLCYLAKARPWTTSEPTQEQVPCFFILGDSLVDNGNNNDAATIAKANFEPYGIDFPHGATGRFTNGLTVVDALAQQLGFTDFIPPYSLWNMSSIIKGVNFASAGSGIRDETSKHLGYRVTMNQQVSNFAKALEEIRRVNFQGDAKELQNYIKRCIIFSGMGSNDYLNNYFLPNSTSSSHFTPRAYATALIQEYRHQLENLYHFGARKFIILGPGKIGCLPYELERNNRCNEYKNNVTNIFNKELLKLVDTFNNGMLFGATFVFLDVFQDVEGFEVVNKACCGCGKSNGKATCLPHQTPCENRTQYKYWDSFHPTEKANVLFAERAYKSQSKLYAYPINVKDLAML